MKMKKILAIVLAACMAAAILTSCAKKETPASGQPVVSAPAADEPAKSEPAPEKPDWPKQNINIICPFKAGGGMDLMSRLTARYLEKYLGVTVTVNNVEGGNSWTGWTQVAQAAGDGYTLGVANYPSQVGGYLNPSAGIPFTYRDFAAIANIVSDPNILVVSANHSPYETVEEFIEAAKTKEMVISTGGGVGSDDDVTIAKINAQLGLNIKPGYNPGATDAKVAMLGGHVDGMRRM